MEPLFGRSCQALRMGLTSTLRNEVAQKYRCKPQLARRRGMAMSIDAQHKVIYEHLSCVASSSINFL